MAQLPGQSALRRAESISLLHGEYASAAESQRLRVLPDAARWSAEKVRSSSCRSEGARTKADFAATIRGGRSAQGDDRFYRETGFGEYSRHVIQKPCSEDR